MSLGIIKPAVAGIAVMALIPAFAADISGTVGESNVMKRASGTFEVKIEPQAGEDSGTGAKLGRMLLKKRYSGDLEGEAEGQMLTAVTGTQGSAGYVAIERVTGTLDGRKGAFVLQHSGTMNRGAQELTITVVPDSATDGLKGLTGKLAIRIADGKHYYEFDYTLPE